MQCQSCLSIEVVCITRARLPFEVDQSHRQGHMGAWKAESACVDVEIPSALFIYVCIVRTSGCDLKLIIIITVIVVIILPAQPSSVHSIHPVHRLLPASSSFPPPSLHLPARRYPVAYPVPVHPPSFYSSTLVRYIGRLIHSIYTIYPVSKQTPLVFFFFACFFRVCFLPLLTLVPLLISPRFQQQNQKKKKRERIRH